MCTKLLTIAYCWAFSTIFLLFPFPVLDNVCIAYLRFKGGRYLQGFRDSESQVQVAKGWKWSEVAQSCPTLCDPIDCSLPGSSVHGIFQAIVLEWISISFSRGSSQPTAQTRVSRIVDRRFYHLSHSQLLVLFFIWLYRASPSSAARNIINLISVLTIWRCPCVELFLMLLEEVVC